METLWQDLRYGARQLLRSPGFSTAAVLLLALGLGANTAIFSVVNALLLRPLPVHNPGELAAVFTSDFSGPLYGGSSYPDYADFRDRNQVLSGLAAYNLSLLAMERSGQTERVTAEFVSANYFSLLGLAPSSGRDFLPEEDRLDDPGPVALISHGYWQRRWGSNPAAIGSSVELNGAAVTIVGIGPPGFSGLTRGLGVDLWVPLAMQQRLLGRHGDLRSRGSRGLFLIGRLRPGVSLEQARANFSLLGQQLHEAYRDHWVDVRGDPRVVTVLPESQIRVPPEARLPLMAFLALLQAVMALVLVIACANLANLLLARAAARRREVAVRLSLGARRWRLVRQLLTESVLLALTAGVGAVLLALWLVPLLLAFQPPLPVRLELDLSSDYRVLLFALGLALATGIAFGLVPAWQATKVNLLESLKSDIGASTGIRTRSTTRNTLVVAQVAVSLLLLVGAGLFLRSLLNAEAIDPGFDADNVLVASVNLDELGYTPAEGHAFFERLQERLESVPQVERVSLAESLPLGLGPPRRNLAVQGYEPAPGEDMEFHYNLVGPGFFETLRIPLVQGRGFTPQDNAGAPGVVVVNEAFARRFWPGQDPLGKRMSMGVVEENEVQVYPLEVVGVARDGKYVTLGEEARPFVFYPQRQNYEGAMTVLLRTRREPEEMARQVREEIRALDPRLAVYDVKSLHDHLGVGLLPVRLAATLLGLMGGLALLLAALGLYAVMAYAVSLRTREIGIRVALGAQPRDVLRMVVQHGMVLTGIGLAVGLGAALAATRLLSFFLYGISPTDPVTFVGVSLLLTAAAMLACWVPARRAARVDPMVALRYE